MPDPIPAPLSLFITCHLTCCHSLSPHLLSLTHLAPFSMHRSLYKASHPLFVPPLMKTIAWLSKHLAIINQFWLVKSGNGFNMSTPIHKRFFSFAREKYGREILALIRGFVVTSKHIVTQRQHLAFSSRCKRYQLIPKFYG